MPEGLGDDSQLQLDGSKALERSFGYHAERSRERKDKLGALWLQGSGTIDESREVDAAHVAEQTAECGNHSLPLLWYAAKSVGM